MMKEEMNKYDDLDCYVVEDVVTPTMFRNSVVVLVLSVVMSGLLHQEGVATQFGRYALVLTELTKLMSFLSLIAFFIAMATGFYTNDPVEFKKQEIAKGNYHKKDTAAYREHR